MTKSFYRHLIILGLSLACPSALAKKAPPTATMLQFRQTLQELAPYLSSFDKFDADQNHRYIEQRLDRFVELGQHRSELTLADIPDYGLTLETLFQLLSQLQQSFHAGHKERARMLLQSTVGVCISCHSRLPVGAPIFSGDDTTEWVQAIPNPVERARLLFAFRRFGDAEAVLRRAIQGYPSNGIHVYELVRTLDYLATIYTRVDGDPALASKRFAEIVHRGNLPRFVQEDLEVWLGAFRLWQAEQPFDIDNAQDAEVLTRVEEILGPAANQPRFLADRALRIPYLRASALLHQLLIKRPRSPRAAEAEYLLGICYMSLDQDLFVGFDGAYLKSCIHRDPTTRIARKCYNLYEESVYLGFTGSAGTSIPPEIQKELSSLRDQVYPPTEKEK